MNWRTFWKMGSEPREKRKFSTMPREAKLKALRRETEDAVRIYVASATETPLEEFDASYIMEDIDDIIVLLNAGGK